MINENVILVDRNEDGTYDQLKFRSAIRTVQRYLKMNGFRRGKTTNSIHINPDHIAWRNRYIRSLLENRCKPLHERKMDAYTNESYIHHHHHHHDADYLFHPTTIYQKSNKTQGATNLFHLCYLW